jgi:hypothetical protein
VSEEEGARFESTVAGARVPEDPRTCAWCATPARPEETTCSSCGAPLAQRESIGDLAIPGLTAVDAALLDFDDRPLRLRGPSPSQGVAPALIVGAMAGGPIGLAAIGGVAAVAAVEYLGARRDGAAALEAVGRPSEIVLQALEHLDEHGPSEATADAAATSLESGPVMARTGGAGAEPVIDDGRSIWRDLPPVALAFEAREPLKLDEEGVADGS